MVGHQPRQIALDLGHEPTYGREDLVASAANRDALVLVDGWPNWPSPVVVLAGPPGSGKTHLAHAWLERSGAASLPPGRIGAVAPGRSILVEDADRTGLDEAGLFHAINAVRAENGFMLLTARSFPAAWRIALPDLASRLRAATVVELHEPDDALLGGVITKLFADRQVEVDTGLIDYLVRRIERSIASAIAIVDRLDRMGLEEKSRITRPMAARLLDALERGEPLA